jgi:hypothetical protein
MLRRKTVTHLSLFMVLVIVVIIPATRASKPEVEGIDSKPSSYAPAKDLVAQADEFMKGIEKDLASEAEYGEDQRDRVVKNANTLAVIALVLSNHDDVVSLRAPGAQVIKASLDVAESAGDYSKAKSAFGELKSVMKMTGDKVPMKWESVGDIGELMLQVPILNTSLRRAVLGRRFAASRDKSAALTATLAAVAQISIYDETYCSDEDEQKEWVELFILMRDAAGQCNRAVREGDQDKAKHWLKEMTRACDDCHEKFRD